MAGIRETQVAPLTGPLQSRATTASTTCTSQARLQQVRVRLQAQARQTPRVLVKSTCALAKTTWTMISELKPDSRGIRS